MWMTRSEQEMLEFWKALDPAVDFAFAKASRDGEPEYLGGSKVKRPAKVDPTPLFVKLTETYVDLKLALDHKNPQVAERNYTYLKRVLGWS